MEVASTIPQPGDDWRKTMENREFKTANVKLCFQKLKEMMEVLPVQEGDHLEWDHDKAIMKERCLRALAHLDMIFSDDPDDVPLPLGGCTVLSIDPPALPC